MTTTIKKTLGRCSGTKSGKRHTQVVEYEEGTLPSGTCRTCGETLVEWAVK